MHFTSHKALIKSPGEHAVSIEMSQQRAGLRHKHKEERSTGSGCRVAAALARTGTNRNGFYIITQKLSKYFLI